MHILRFVALFIFILCSLPLFAQDSVSVVPGAEFEAGWLHRLVFGSAWRDLWTTPVQVEIIDMESLAPGLHGIRADEQPESSSLRFRGGGGEEYEFKPFDKDPQNVLDPLLLKSVTESAAADLVATTNPVSALVASSLLEAAGRRHVAPELAQLPDDERLAEFREAFKNRAGILEKHPAVREMASSYELFKRLDEDHRNRVDARAYLQERLMDVLLGDWDRGFDRWQWRKNVQGATTWWLPLPESRDQAFCRYNGIVGWYAAQQISQIESCSESYPWIADLTWSGRHADRRFLSSLERGAWDSITNAIYESLTDEAIESAARKLPPEMYAKEGENLTRTLKSRRDMFKDASSEFYDNLARFVDVWASDKNEYAEIERLNNDSVRVSLFKRDKETGGAQGVPFFQRTFVRRETREIRLYLQGGDDFAIVKGNAEGSIPLRIIGGEGSDELADSSTVRGSLLGVLPIKTSRTSTYFYENDRKAEFIYGSSTSAMPDNVVRPREDSLKYEPLYRDWGHEWKGFPWLSYNSDDGAFIGAIARLTNYGFYSLPYHDQAAFKAGYAFGASRFRVVYDHEFRNVWGGELHLFARASSLEALNFFGFGNDTKYDAKLAERDHYRVKQMQYAFQPSYAISPMEHVTIRGLAGMRLFRTDTSGMADSALLRLVKPYGVQDATYAIAGISGTYDSRDNAAAPQEGVYFMLGALWNPEIFDNRFAYTKGQAEFRGYYTAPVLGGATVAIRARGEKIFGNRFPFYESAFLGGATDLRGYARERFAGDAAMLGTLELRLNIGKFFVIVPGRYGVHLFAEEGRVFYEKETSEARHGSFGGGVWIAPLGVGNTVALTIARSPEQTTYAIAGGFAF